MYKLIITDMEVIAMNEDKKVILIKGGSSRWFEQAIFILKDSGDRKNMPKNFVSEAEKIINSYMMRKYQQNDLSSVYSKTNPPKAQKTVVSKPQKSKTTKKWDKILNISIISLCLFIGFILYYFM